MLLFKFTNDLLFLLAANVRTDDVTAWVGFELSLRGHVRRCIVRFQFVFFIMITTGLFTSNTDLWATPTDFFEKVAAEFAPETDVCALPENAKCERFFTPEIDGLKQSWSGTCWMNPPYGREIGKWVQKAHDEAKKGAKVVCLLPARTDTRWFHDHILGIAETRFIKGRLKFGDSKNSAPFPSMLVIYDFSN